MNFRSFIAVLVLLLSALDACAAITATGFSTKSTGSAAATSLVVTPVSVANGAARADLLLAQVTIASSTATITAPAGWTELTAVAQSYNGIQQRIYWRIRSDTTTESATYTWTFSSAVRGTVILGNFAGVDTNQPINAWASGLGVDSTLVAADAAASYSNGVLIAFFGTTGVASTITPQASMTSPATAKTNAVSGSSGVQAALAYETLTSDGFTGTRTATGSNGTYATQTLVLTPAPSDVCFTDHFNRASLGSDWATSSMGATSFIPVINTTAGNQRLQLTSNLTYEATLAALQRYFPAAGNKVTVSFNHYAYGGGGSTGADGVVVIFSDATVPPAAGGAGGSLGYAQYSNPANTPGFAGGWLGIGLDEFGNFSNATENRYLGNAAGAVANAIAIRGPSNTFFTGTANAYKYGYPYLAGTGTLATTISNPSNTTPGAPGYLYRITIDSRIAGEQWIRVDRNVGGGAIDQNLIADFNLMSKLSTAGIPTTTTPIIPANFWLSFTGGTGGQKNIHELDNLQVCATKMIAATPVIDHFRFENSGAMDTCNTALFKVTACTKPEPACVPFTAGDVYVTLKPSGWIGGDAVKLIGGSRLLQLSQGTTGTITLDIDKTKSIFPQLINPATSTVACVLPGTNTPTSCNVTVSQSTSGFGITFPATSQTACDDSGDVTIKACKSGYTSTSKSLRFSYSYTDPSSGTQGLTASTNVWTSSTAIAQTSAGTTAMDVLFDANSTTKIRLKYADVGKLTLNVSDTNVSPNVTGSKTFIVRPASFAITGVTDMAGTNNPAAADATGGKFVAAGASFKVTAEARNNCSPAAVTKNFGKESTPEGIQLSASLVAGLGLTNNPALVTETNFAFSNGAGTAVVNWPEVGIIQLTPRLKSGAYMGTADVLGASYGSNVGRFYADHFDVTLTQGCGVGGFTYDKQPFPTTTLIAKAKNGSMLQNYRGSSTASLSFAKPITLSDTTGKDSITPLIPALAFTNGSALLDNADVNHPRATFSFNVSPSAPANIAVAAVDSDNGTGLGTNASASIRSGRIRMQNAYGSERLALPVPLEAQYWQGSGSGGYWTLNTLDSCTVLPMSSFALTSTFTSSCQSQITPTGSVTLTNGKMAGAGLVLTKPNQAGKVLLTLNTSTAAGNTCTTSTPSTATAAGLPWLPMYPAGSVLANFGIYKSPLIDRRENY